MILGHSLLRPLASVQSNWLDDVDKWTLPPAQLAPARGLGP